MSFSQEWDCVYGDDRHRSIWPWSDVVSYVHRHAAPRDGFRRVLELGCGAGANIPFFLKLGMDYWGIEGSSFAVAALRDTFPELKHKIAVGDFTDSIPLPGPFGLVLDRAALTHNPTTAIQSALRLVFELLRPSGKLIGIDWFSASHSDTGRGRPVDAHTRTDIPSGQFQGVGAVHFADRDHLTELLTTAGFTLERLEHKRSEMLVPDEGVRFAAWNFVAIKP
jgi:SAM-dependent methyltransferase